MSNNNDIRKFIAAKAASGDAGDDPTPTGFNADTLRCHVTDSQGNTVLDCNLNPKGFKAKKDNRSGKWGNTLGWQAMPKGDDSGTYCDVAVTGNIMLYLGIGKVPAGRPEAFELRSGDPGDVDTDGEDS